MGLIIAHPHLSQDLGAWGLRITLQKDPRSYGKQMDSIPKSGNKVVMSCRSVAESDRSKNLGVSDSPRLVYMVLWRTYGKLFPSKTDP